MDRSSVPPRLRSLSLCDLLSPEIFRNYPISLYRSKMARAIKEWLARNQVSTAASAYSSSHDDTMIRFRDDDKPLDGRSSAATLTTTTAIDWGQLFEHHDQTKKAQTQSTTVLVKGETILEVLLETIRNPTVCPVVFWPFFGEQLLFATIIHKSNKGATNPQMSFSRHRNNRWQESQKLVIAYITDILHHHACLRPAVLVSLLSSQELFDCCSSKIDHVQNLSRIIQHWLGEFPQYRKDLLKSFLRLCDVLEEIEITSRQEQQQLSVQHRIVNDTHINTPKRSSPFNLAYLHGELSESEEIQLTNRVRRYHRHSKARRDCHHTNLLVDSSSDRLLTDECTVIILKAWRLQAKYIGRIFLSVARRASYAWARTGSTWPRKTAEAAEATVAHVITHECPASPLRRLCSILWATENEDGTSQHARFDALLRVLWHNALRSRVDNLQHCCAYICWYAEIVVECSCFDNIDKLWQALLPWSGFLDEQHRRNQNNQRLRPFLRGLATVLAHRGRMLRASLKYKSAYQTMMSRLALRYDHPGDWLDPNALDYDKYMQALQMAGILGVSNIESAHDASTHTKLSDTPAGALGLPFLESSFCVRSKLNQMRQFLSESIPRSHLLSDYSPVNGVPPIPFDS